MMQELEELITEANRDQIADFVTPATYLDHVHEDTLAEKGGHVFSDSEGFNPADLIDDGWPPRENKEPLLEAGEPEPLLEAFYDDSPEDEPQHVAERGAPFHASSIHEEESEVSSIPIERTYNGIRAEPFHASMIHEEEKTDSEDDPVVEAEASQETALDPLQEWWKANRSTVKEPFGMKYWADRWEKMTDPENRRKVITMGLTSIYATGLQVEPAVSVPRTGAVLHGAIGNEVIAHGPDLVALAHETPINATGVYTGTDYLNDMNEAFGTHFTYEDWGPVSKHLSKDVTFGMANGEGPGAVRWNHQGLVSDTDKLQTLKVAQELGRM